VIPVAVILPDLDTGSEDLEHYRQRGGYQGLERARAMDPEAIVDLIDQAGLLGRGGASFPTAKKWRLALESGGATRYLVVNGAEGEPGSFKDRTLMARAPHAVLEGILIAARALLVREVPFYINNLFEDAVQALSQALKDADQAGLLNGVEVRLIPESHVYIAGEETALINVLMGRPAQPWHKPPYPAQEGFQGKPTVVNNVETLALVGAILREGASWFRDHRPALFSLSGDVERPGVYELPLGTPLSALLERAGGPVAGTQLTAVLPGGYSMPPLFSEHWDVPLDPAALKRIGSGLGASIIAVSSRRTLGQVAFEVLEFFARESCGKCPVCVKGSRIMADQLKSGQEAPLSDEEAEAVLTSALKYRHKGICSFLDTAAHFAEATAPYLKASS
jgi:NADH-quinone oxidoreductase subunit F